MDNFCPFEKSEPGTQHYNSPEEARAAYENAMSERATPIVAAPRKNSPYVFGQHYASKSEALNIYEQEMKRNNK